MGSLLLVRAEGFEPSIRRLDGAESVRVTLVPCRSGPREVRVVEAATGAPVPGVVAHTTYGYASRPSGPDGLVSLPGCLLRNEFSVFFLREGFHPTSCRTAELPREVELARLCDLEVIVAGLAPSDRARLWVESGLEGGSLRVFDSNPVSRPARAVQRIRAPVGREVALAVLAADGRSAETSLRLQSAAATVTLELARERPLRVHARTPPTSSAVAVRADYGEPWGSLALEVESRAGGGVAYVPLPGRTEQVLVTASGCPPARIAPLTWPEDAWQGDFGGEVTVELRPEAALRITTLDGGGSPVPGMGVTVWPLGFSRRAFAEHPDLGGDLPTTHPGWKRTDPVWAYGVTGPDGSVLLTGITRGPNGVSVSPPDFALGDGFGGWSGGSLELDLVEPLTERTVRVGRPVRLSIEAFDELTGAPVRGFEVALPDGSTREASRMSEVWTGLVPAPVDALRVRAPGYGSERVEIPPGPDRRLRVGLRPVAPMLVEISGHDPSAEELRLVLAIGREGEGTSFYPSWQTDLRASPSGRGELTVPAEPGRPVRILHAYVDGEEVGAAPSGFPWAPGGRVEVTVTGPLEE